MIFIALEKPVKTVLFYLSSAISILLSSHNFGIIVLQWGQSLETSILTFSQSCFYPLLRVSKEVRARLGLVMSNLLCTDLS